MTDALTPVAATPVANPNAPAFLGPPVAAPRPGFDPAGAPLPDDQVWKGFTAKPVNSGNGMTRTELLALGMAAAGNPTEFVQRLLADSRNGSAVSHAKSYRTDYGMLKVELSAADGQLSAKATITPYKKFVKGTFAEILTSKPKTMPSLSLTTTSKLGEDGSLTDVKLAVDIVGLPTLDAKKIAREKKTLTAQRKALREATKSKRLAGVVDATMRVFSEPERFLPLILADLTDDSQGLSMRIKPDEFAAAIVARLGAGKFSLKVDHLFSGKKHTKEDLNVLGTMSGTVANDKDITIEKISFATTQKIDVKFPAGAGPDAAEVTVDGRPANRDEIFGLGSAALVGALALRDR
jgi:hypothetical protein